MTDAKALAEPLAEVLRRYANEPWATMGGRPLLLEAANAITQFSLREAALVEVVRQAERALDEAYCAALNVTAAYLKQIEATQTRCNVVLCDLPDSAARIGSVIEAAQKPYTGVPLPSEMVAVSRQWLDGLCEALSALTPAKETTDK